jgi:hypothetical protein
VCAVLVHLSLWDEAWPRSVSAGAASLEPAEFEYLPWVE